MGVAVLLLLLATCTSSALCFCPLSSPFLTAFGPTARSGAASARGLLRSYQSRGRPSFGAGGAAGLCMMPEGPECATMADQLRGQIRGRIPAPSSRRLVLPNAPVDLSLRRGSVPTNADSSHSAAAAPPLLHDFRFARFPRTGMTSRHKEVQSI